MTHQSSHFVTKMVRSPTNSPAEGNEIAGAIAGAMAVSEAFRRLVLGDVAAGVHTQRLCPITPGRSCDVRLDRLPSEIWLLGLGNVGQATLWILGLLPYADPGLVSLVLQDSDISGAENLDVQVLTDYQWVGQRKARAAARWAEAHRFHTAVTERRFLGGTRREEGEPLLSFVGVDNLPTRRLAARAGFGLMIDVGLGASTSETFDIRISSFPGDRSPEEVWPESEGGGEGPLNRALSDLVSQGRLSPCGAATISGQSVGVPSTAIAAAAIQVAQACRAAMVGTYCDFVDVSLRRTRAVMSHDTALSRPGVIPTTEVRRE